VAGFDLDGVFDDEDYRHFYFNDQKSSDAGADVEAGQIVSLLSLQPGQRVLDAPCGHGRITERLAQRGCRMVSIDRAPHFISLAEQNAQALGLDIDYRVGDLRELSLTEEFDAGVNWFTSFGYFDDATDRDLLRRFHAALRPGGRLLLELQNRDRLLRLFNPTSGHAFEVGSDVMLDRNTFDPVSGRITTTRYIVTGGRMRRTQMSVRVFTFTEIRDWLIDAGFGGVQAFDRESAPFTLESPRMAVIAEA
jgi:SAM-dependent methyltransferase